MNLPRGYEGAKNEGFLSLQNRQVSHRLHDPPPPFVTSDETWFHLNGYINTQNYRVWRSENPHVFQTSLHPQKLALGAP